MKRSKLVNKVNTNPIEYLLWLKKIDEYSEEIHDPSNYSLDKDTIGENKGLTLLEVKAFYLQLLLFKSLLLFNNNLLLPIPSPKDFPDPEIKPGSPALQAAFFFFFFYKLSY